MVQAQSVTNLMDSHLQEVNAPVTDLTNCPVLVIVKMNISRDDALSGYVGVGKSPVRSVKWFVIAVMSRLKPAKTRSRERLNCEV